MQKYLALCNEIPYYAATVNYAIQNEMVKIAVVPYQGIIVNHDMENKTTQMNIQIWDKQDLWLDILNAKTKIKVKTYWLNHIFDLSHVCMSMASEQ